jgi:hypothetical protein
MDKKKAEIFQPFNEIGYYRNCLNVKAIRSSWVRLPSLRDEFVSASEDQKLCVIFEFV